MMRHAQNDIKENTFPSKKIASEEQTKDRIYLHDKKLTEHIYSER
jgi:hypothetical protein